MQYIINIIVALINGIFILIAAVFGASIVSKRTQMRKYSKKLVSTENNLRVAKSLLEHNFDSHLKQIGQQSAIHNTFDESKISYCQLVSDYNELITEINLFCGSNIQPKFFYPKFDEDTGEINYEE